MCQAQLQGSSWNRGAALSSPGCLWPAQPSTIPAGPGTTFCQLVWFKIPLEVVYKGFGSWEAPGLLWKGGVPRGSEFYIASVVELHLRVPIQGREPKIAACSKERSSGVYIVPWCFEISSGPHQSWWSEKQHLTQPFTVQHHLCWGYHLFSKIPHLLESFRLLL